MKELTKNFIEENIDVIEQREFDTLYRNYPCTPPDLTETLLGAGINPLLYFKDTIPAFYAQGLESIKSLNIPDNITIIGQEAFSKCTKLERVCFSENLRIIGLYTFNECEYLTKVYIPDSTLTVSRSAFKDCKALEDVSIGKNTRVTYDTFEGCKSLHHMEFRGTIRELEKLSIIPFLKFGSLIKMVSCNDGVVDLETLVRNTL